MSLRLLTWALSLGVLSHGYLLGRNAGLLQPTGTSTLFSIRDDYLRIIEDNRKNAESNRIEVKGITIDSFFDDKNIEVPEKTQVKLVDTGSGWGDGTHPTTRLCLDFIADSVREGDIVVDYGCGSGILSIFAAKSGAKKCMAIDVDEDCLRAAQRNVDINLVHDVVQVIHTARVVPGDLIYPQADVTIANILPGPLTRLVAALWLSTKPGGEIL